MPGGGAALAAFVAASKMVRLDFFSLCGVERATTGNGADLSGVVSLYLLD